MKNCFNPKLRAKELGIFWTKSVVAGETETNKSSFFSRAQGEIKITICVCFVLFFLGYDHLCWVAAVTSLKIVKEYFLFLKKNEGFSMMEETVEHRFWCLCTAVCLKAVFGHEKEKQYFPSKQAPSNYKTNTTWILCFSFARNALFGYYV